MILNIRYISVVIVYLCYGTSVSARHDGKADKCSQFDCVYGLMEQSVQLRAELEALKNKVKDVEDSAALQRNPVAFCAGGLNDLSPGHGETLIYNDIVYNEGATYHPSTGMFVATEPGVYIFSILYCNAWTKVGVVGLKHNDEVVLVSSSYEDVYGVCTTASSYLTLTVGDTVMVVNTFGGDSGFIEDAFRMNRFCGHRIY